ncbi:histidine-type phosphatase [Desulfovibrio sp. ZJ369]|uniref:histidine-type phosphatase n=1 Tax=Desulfovibrio sp. ZJ369 TaxID=2709793 RepID=UPI0013ED420D|nr:histidine-type phosphatase [Desulfovibrio sp. ZJ369]
MRVIRFFLFLLICGIFSGVPADCAFAGADGDKARLLKVVALSRHGVRSPTQDMKTLALWSSRPWPHWPVPRGDLTARGGRLITAMWTELRGTFMELGLLPHAACPPPGAIFVRADTDQRTLATARALLAGLAPGCETGYAVADGRPDPLFHPVKAGLCAFDPAAAASAVLSMTPGGLDRLHEEYSAPLALIDQLTAPPAPELCAFFALPRQCRISDLPTSISVSPKGRSVRLSGCLGIASSLAEIFLLEYGQWPGRAAAWGQADGQVLARLLPLHSRVFDVINRAPLVARARGSSLLKEMADALAGRHYDQRLNAARLVVFVGHDTNIANIGSLLGVTWQARGWPPDGIPPGSALFLELWGVGERREVRVRFYAQTPAALHTPLAGDHEQRPEPPFSRNAGQDAPRTVKPEQAGDAALFAPAAAVVTAPPVVGEARFSLAAFEELVRKRINQDCLAPQQTPALRHAADAAQ